MTEATALCLTENGNDRFSYTYFPQKAPIMKIGIRRNNISEFFQNKGKLLRRVRFNAKHISSIITSVQIELPVLLLAK